MSCKYCDGIKRSTTKRLVISDDMTPQYVVFGYCPSCGRSLKPSNPVEAAYISLVEATSKKDITPGELTNAIEEAIGYLGEALE